MSMNTLKRFPVIFDRVLDSLIVLAVVLLAAAWLLVVIDVFLRAFTTLSITWKLEIVEYAMVYLTLLGAAWVLRQGRQISVDMVLHRLKSGPRAVVNIVTSVLGAITFLVLAWYSGEVTWIDFRMGYIYGEHVILKAPAYIISAILPFGSFLLFIQFARRAYGFMRA